MPTPREAFTNSVQREGYSGARVRAADFGSAGEIMGRALQGAGQDIAKVGDVFEAIEQRDAKTAAQQADNFYVKKRLDRMYKGPEAFFNKEGKSALDDQEQLSTDLAVYRQEAAATLKNPLAQRMFEDIATRRETDELPSIYKHANNQRLKFEELTDAVAKDQAIDLAVVATDPEVADRHIATAGNLAVQRMARKGMIDEASLTQARQEGVGEAVAKRASRLAIDQPLEAQAFVNTKADQMDPDAVTELLSSLAPRANKELASTKILDELVYTDGGEASTSDEMPTTEGATEPSARKEKPLDMAAGYEVTSNYGRRARPVKADGTLGSADHGGLDLGYRMGTPVKASLSGRVRNREGGGYGKYTDIDHGNGLVSRYAHLSAYKFKDGATVNQGDIVALSGNSGGVKAHLHYELRQNDQTIDPRGNKAGEVRVELAGRTSAPRSSANIGREVDIVGTIASIRSKGYSFTLEEALISEARESHSLGRQAKADGEEQMRVRTAEFLNTLPNPDNFTDTSQLPPELLRDLKRDPEMLLAIRTKARANVETREARARAQNAEARGALAEQAEWKLLRIMEDDPESFKRINFERDAPALTHSDQIRFHKLQQTVIKGPEGGGKGVDVNALRTEVNRYGSWLPSKTPEDKKSSGVIKGRILEAAIQLEQKAIADNGGKPLTQVQRRGIAKLVSEPTYLRTKSKSEFVPRSEVARRRGEPGFRDATVDKRQRVKAQMMTRTGIEPDDQDISDAIASGEFG